MNDVIDDDVAIIRLSLCKNEILVSKMYLFIFNWRTAAIFYFLNAAIVTSTYARHSLNARNELLAF